MEAAAIMAIALANGGGKPPDWQDFVGIITLLVINSTISFIEENNAGNAAAALMARLAPKAKDLPTTVFLLVKLTQRHLRLPGISMRRSGEWGDHLTLQAAADKFAAKICLLTSFRDTCFIEIMPLHQAPKRELWLSFWSEVHYNSLYSIQAAPPPQPPRRKHWLF